MTRKIRNIVIGAGAVGLSAGYHLARRGAEVAVLEQYPFGHRFGSSHGASRITRHSYVSSTYSRIMPRAYRLWTELEAATGRKLFTRTGGLSAAFESKAARIAANLDEIHVPYRVLDPKDLSNLFPSFSADPGMQVIFEPDAGILSASAILRALSDTLRSLGGRVYEQTKVLGIENVGTAIRIALEGDDVECERLIVAAGPWTASLIPELGPKLATTKQEVAYFEPPDRVAFRPENFPVFLYHLEDELYYGLPAFNGAGIKIAKDEGQPMPIDGFDRESTPHHDEAVRGFVRGYLPPLAAAPIIAREVCVYTMCGDEEFIVGLSKSRPGMLVASPCSGHGFKLSHLVGKVLAELALDGESMDLPESWGRFVP